MTDPQTRSPQLRWWYCPACYAVNSSTEDSRCWNCERPFPRTKQKPWIELRRTKCSVCHESYLAFVLPADTYLKGEEFEMGLCPRYFEHLGENAYFPPMLPLIYMMQANDWEYNERTKKVVKARKSPS